jgi:putative membrane protein
VTRSKINSVHLFLFFIVFVFFIWSVIKPEEGYGTWLVEVLPSVVLLIYVIATYKKFRFSTLSYVIMALLSILTFIGGHYSYSKVPLFNWIKDYFDLQRNHYDRFGHFLKGLMVLVIIEILIRKTSLIKSKTTTFIAICISLSIGALYEIIEWVSTKIAKGTVTKNFMGMQGDQWDAQWDMSFLLVGSILAVLFFSKLLYKLLVDEK